MNELDVGWELEMWRRKGIEVTIVSDCRLEITGNAEQDIDQIANLVVENKQKILGYLRDGDSRRYVEGQPGDRPRDTIPSVCQSCSRLEMVDRGNEVMAGCLYESSADSFSFGWRRFPAGSKGCIWLWS